MNNYIGQFSALMAAFLWATSSIIYSSVGEKIPPLKLNLIKGLIAIALILITLSFQGSIFNNDLSISTFCLLSLSGILGIGLGDTAYFLALNQLGARRTLLLETLAPPFGALLAFIFIKETINIEEQCGILFTLLGVAWVISERTANNNNNSDRMRSGIIWGILAAMAQAGGAVLSRFALINSEINPLESSLIRLIAGSAIALLLYVLPFYKKSSFKKQNNNSFRIIITIIVAAFFSTYLGIWLQQIALKFTETGIAQTLLSTSPLFILPLVIFRGEKVSLRSFMGVLISLIGIGLLFL